jgi:hypothetical protein
VRIARYWALDEAVEKDPRGEEVARWVYGGSDVSEADAKAEARRRAEAIAQRIRMGEIGGRFHEKWYEYARLSKPEPIVEEFHDDGGRRVGAITANRYGAYVLNTAELAFVDVDLRPRVNSLLGSLLGRKKPDPEREALDKLEAWVGSGGGRAARAYRTRSGLRYLIPSPMMRPDTDQTRAIMDQLGADKLYVTLCKHQQSFRARLTPKPWRLPPSVPSPDYRAGGAPSEAWRSSHAVCELLGEFGRAEESASTTELVAVHDAWTNVGSGLPLA